MILWGEIKHWPLFAVLQFLSGQRRTGVLEVQDYEKVGQIYMSRGRIEGITSPAWDEMLATKLVAIRAVTESQVKECFLEVAEREDALPALVLLLEQAKGDLRALREIVDQHVGDAIMQLMFWHSGTFRFTLPAHPVSFPIVPFRDVEHFVIDAIRRVDEGERPWRERLPGEADLCTTCTLECSEETKSRFLKADVCLWRSIPSTLQESIYPERPKRASLGDEDELEDLPFL